MINAAAMEVNNKAMMSSRGLAPLFYSLRGFSSSLKHQTAPPVAKSRKWLRFAAWTGGVLGAIGLSGGIYYSSLDNIEKRKARVAVGGIRRFIRCLRIGLMITGDYWWSLRNIEEDSEEYEAALNRIHQRSADAILYGCLKNGGLYIKLGQGLVSLNHILPKAYLRTLHQLQDQCLVRREKEVQDLFLEEFGKSQDDMFESFDTQPIAAASLAQVFRATTKDGKEVAVKVQYIDLQDRFFGDIATINILLHLSAMIHTKYDFRWVLNELTETLQQELDFINEGRNGERCAKELAHFNFVYVPKIEWTLCSKKVLTTEFIKGSKVDDVPALKSEGFSLADIDTKLFKAFSEQIFHTGFVHADPHPGNVLIRKGRDQKAEIVLLDHGLYQYLPNHERQGLCNLWKSIVLHDYKGMEQYSKELGVEENYRLFCMTLVQYYIPPPKGEPIEFFSKIMNRGDHGGSRSRMLNQLSEKEKTELQKKLLEVQEKMMKRPLKLHKNQLKLSLSEDDMKYMSAMARQRFDKITLALRQMPKNLLLVIRNINTIRAIAKIHGDPVDRYKVMARSATRGAFVSNDAGITQRLQGQRQYLLFELRLFTDALLLWIRRCFMQLLVSLKISPDFEKVFKEQMALS